MYYFEKSKFIVPGYKDLIKIEAVNSDEKMVKAESINISSLQNKFVDINIMLPKSDIYVRKSINDKLKRISNQLLKLNYKLVIIEGYRSLERQKSMFDSIVNKLLITHPNLSQDVIFEMAHTHIAMPNVSGHPTGGAVDVFIVDKDGDSLDFGCAPWTFDSRSQYDAFEKGLISEAANLNRILLYELMKEEDFIEFYGEWWHFSYGDKEWAYANKTSAIYSQLTDSQILLE
jgi:zinc D-Ala-D-Ala dipeptidase